jgi:hypothetical protein
MSYVVPFVKPVTVYVVVVLVVANVYVVAAEVL